MKKLFYLAVALAIIGVHIAAVMLLSGCSLVPTEKQQSQSVKSTEAISTSHDRTIERALEVTPEYGMKVSNAGTITVRDLNSPPQAPQTVSIVPLAPSVRETLTIRESSGQNAGSHDTAAGTSITSIPFGVKIVLIGIGILILTFSLIFAWRYVKTTAVGQGINLGDAILSSHIKKLRDRAINATDPAVKAQHMADIAELESERGKTAALAK